MSWTGVKQAARGLARANMVLDLLARGMSVGAISQQIGISRKAVTDAMHRALKTESRYPGSLSPDAVQSLRTLQAEILAGSRRMALVTQAKVAARVGTENEKNMDATASARLLEAVVRAIDLEANLFGSKVPLRIQEESLRLQVNVHRSEKGTTMLTWDRSILTKPVGPVAGLTMYEGCRSPNALAFDSSARDLLADGLDVPARESLPVANVTNSNGDTAP